MRGEAILKLQAGFYTESVTHPELQKEAEGICEIFEVSKPPLLPWACPIMGRHTVLCDFNRWYPLRLPTLASLARTTSADTLHAAHSA